MILTACREDRLKELESNTVDIFPGDLASAGFIEKINTYIFNNHGKCDVLINSAGIMNTWINRGY